MSQMLSNVLAKENIFTHLKSESKEEAIKRAGELLVASELVESSYIEKMLDRETLTTTYIGSGVAIPHGTKESKAFVKKTGIVFLQYPEGVDFLNGNIAYLVIGIAALGDEHMDILMNIADAVGDEDTLKALIHEKDPHKIYNLLGND